MRLQNFYQLAKTAQENNQFLAYGIEAIAEDQELATHIQDVLIWLKFLEPPADGKFGTISTNALIEFQERMSEKIPEIKEEKGFLGLITAKTLIETSPTDVPPRNIDYSNNDLAARIIKYMEEQKYSISLENKQYNIVYVEGMNPDGSLNNDAPNQFNDLRLVIEIPTRNYQPIIVDKWEATTEPGSYYTVTAPLNPNGAARIAFGQYKAWQVGIHKTHEALIQVKNVTVYRDKNKDFMRTGDATDTGLFGINQHWGYDYPRADIKMGSAGCLVGRTTQGHKEFMALIKQDKRYQSNQNYLFNTTIIPGDKLMQRFPNGQSVA